ncbi:MFS general substrate transporter [Dentipellis sp. KUC8613]|nr:MFS general substrate transporter [Dentipellis sp. KUC8613]
MGKPNFPLTVRLQVEFEKDDRRDPANFSRTRKWAITMTACLFTCLSATAASTYNLGFDTMTRDLNCTEFQATIGLSVYALGFGIVPLLTASLSEEFGRQSLYIVSCFGFMMMHLMVALAHNIQTVIIARFLGGAFGSTASTMVGGSIADIWRPYERGLPMAIYSVTALGGTSIGPIAAGWIDADPRLGWRWIQWIHVIATGVTLVGVCLIMTETRASVILKRLAKKIRKETGDHRYRAHVEDESASLKTLIYISCTRPIYLLISEPIVASFSLWVGFAWGILYCLIESITPVFRTIYGFNVGETGTVFAALLIGTLLGFCSNIHQERLYQAGYPKRGPEARLYWVCAAGVVFPIGMFIYAWTTYSFVTWVAPAIAIVIVIWAIYLIYLAVFTYLADCYGPFASSALAGQSLCRNLMGMAFPLFTQQMIAKLTVHWSNTLFACIAVLMAPIPLILFTYGPKIRARSKFSRQVTHT